MNYNLICRKCVLDSGTPNTNLYIDENGICNNCKNYEVFVKKNIVGLNQNDRDQYLKDLVAKIKFFGREKQYDCILGISGGLDSAYLAHKAKELGLRPLVVHFDNGWNSEVAVRNINNLLTKLNYDLETYVIDWESFKDLQLSYIRASVVDIEVPTDHFIYATLYEIANKKGIKYILDGNNIETEFWGVSWKWAYDKLDLTNLQNIHSKFGKLKLKNYPKLGRFQRYFYNNIIGIESAYLLNYEPYNKKKVSKLLEEEYGWEDPGGKHYESIFTRFYQGYILPHKFKIDKRKAHLSNLIWSGQMQRDEALQILDTPTYHLELQKQDRDYFLKKMELSDVEFTQIMLAKPIPHEVYGTDSDKLWRFKFFIRFSESFIGKSIYFILRRFKIIKNLH